MADAEPASRQMSLVERKIAIGIAAKLSPFLIFVSDSLAYCVARIFWGARVTGQHHVPAKGALIIAVTHESVLDPPLTSAFVPRKLRFLARSSLFGAEGEYSAWGRFIRKLGAVPIERGGSGRSTLRTAKKLLQDGWAVLIFPEGTRSTDGELQPFRRGVGLMARSAKCAVLPISMHGTGRIWPKGQKLPRLFGGPVHVNIGAPLTFDKTTSAEDIAAQLRDVILDLRASTAENGGRNQSGPHVEPSAGDGAELDVASGGGSSQ